MIGGNGEYVIFLGQFFPAWSQAGDALQGLAAVNWQEVMLPILTAIGAQGVADFGKESQKIKNGLSKVKAVVNQVKE